MNKAGCYGNRFWQQRLNNGIGYEKQAATEYSGCLYFQKNGAEWIIPLQSGGGRR
ncbi:MAG: hypothetical protein HFG51_05605 [Lachnospiraceae bacterium]|nr:hypothetical protein [Lachnospiraceae bacterium]